MRANPVWLAVSRLWEVMNPDQRRNLVSSYSRLYLWFEENNTFERDLKFSERKALIDMLTQSWTNITLPEAHELDV